MLPQQQDNKLLEDICQLYGISVTDLKHIRSIDDNFVYEFQRSGNEFILRGGTRHPTDLVRAELDWILYLHSSGVNVSVPVHSKNGKYLELVKNGAKVYNTVVFVKAPGKRVDIRNPAEWNEKLWETMGKTVGKIHAASVNYNSENLEFRRRSYLEDEHSDTSILDPVKDAKVVKSFDDIKEKFKQLPKDKDSYGLIHYDFHTDNFNVKGGEVTVYDWDDSHYFFFIYDLAANFHETIWDNPLDKRQDFADRYIPQFWKGYSKEFQLDRKWLELLPDFFRWRDLTIYWWCIKENNDDKVPDHLKQQLAPIITEFRDRIVNDTQIVDIPRDLTEWFPE